MTVAVYYAYLRRAYGLLPAVSIGSLFASSPLLAANAAPGSLYSVVLWVGVRLLLDTLRLPRMWHFRMLVAGLFVGFHAYFLFPFLTYLLWRVPWSKRRVILRSAPFLLLGCSLYIPKWIAMWHHGGVAEWGGLFLADNWVRLQHPAALLTNLYGQLGYALDAFPIWGPAGRPALLSGTVLCWMSIMIVGLLRPQTRRLVSSLAIVLALAACVQSTEKLGAR